MHGWPTSTLPGSGGSGRRDRGPPGSAGCLAGGTAGLTIVGFLLTRTTGLPGFPDNVGNWKEPLGLASLWVEGLVLVLSVYEAVTTPSMKDIEANLG